MNDFLKRSEYDSRNKIMLVDPIFVGAVKDLQKELNKAFYKASGRRRQRNNGKPPITGVMVTGIIGRKIKQSNFKPNIKIDLKGLKLNI